MLTGTATRAAASVRQHDALPGPSVQATQLLLPRPLCGLEGFAMQGDVANFVETEQLIEVGGDGPPVVSSFVVVRGSIPLLWSQIPNIKYKPTTLIAPLQTSDAPFDRHVRELIEKYKVGQTLLRLLLRLHCNTPKPFLQLAGSSHESTSAAAVHELSYLQQPPQCSPGRP